MNNIDKIRQEIERLKEEYDEQVSARLISESLVSMGKVEALNKVLAFIDSLPEEKLSLPSNLAEAEFEYMKSLENAPADQREDLMICDAFKAGVLWMAKQHANDVAEATESAFNAGKEWMAKQGFISEGIIYQTSGKDTTIELNEHIGYLEDCEEVIVNIRKKEENHG